LNNGRRAERLGRKGNRGRRNDRRRAVQLGLFENWRRRLDNRSSANWLGRGGNDWRRGRGSSRGCRRCGLGGNGEWWGFGRWRGRRDVERMRDDLSTAGSSRKFGKLDRSRWLLGLYRGRRRCGPSWRGSCGRNRRRRGGCNRRYQRRLGCHRRRRTGDGGRLSHGWRLGCGNFGYGSRSCREDARQRLRGGQSRGPTLVRNGFNSFHVDLVAVDENLRIRVGYNDTGRRNNHATGLSP